MKLPAVAACALVASLSLASGCASGGTVAARAAPPQVVRLEARGAELDVELALASTFVVPLVARSVDYELWLHGSPVAVGSAHLDTEVPGLGTALVRVPLTASLSGGLPRGVKRRLTRSSRVPLQLRGVVHLHTEDGEEYTAPFERTLTAARVVAPPAAR